MCLFVKISNVVPQKHKANRLYKNNFAFLKFIIGQHERPNLKEELHVEGADLGVDCLAEEPSNNTGNPVWKA